jgi:hypothetical protein
VFSGVAVVCRAQPNPLLLHTAFANIDYILTSMALPIEAIVGIFGMIDTLPPTIYALCKMIHHFPENSVNEGALAHHFKLLVLTHTNEHDIEHDLESQEAIPQHVTCASKPETKTCATLTINTAQQIPSPNAVSSGEAHIHNTAGEPSCC